MHLGLEVSPTRLGVFLVTVRSSVSGPWCAGSQGCLGKGFVSDAPTGSATSGVAGVSPNWNRAASAVDAPPAASVSSPVKSG